MTERPSKSKASFGARVGRIWKRINAVDTFVEVLIIVAMVTAAAAISIYRCVANTLP